MKLLLLSIFSISATCSLFSEELIVQVPVTLTSGGFVERLQPGSTCQVLEYDQTQRRYMIARGTRRFWVDAAVFKPRAPIEDPISRMEEFRRLQQSTMPEDSGTRALRKAEEARMLLESEREVTKSMEELVELERKVAEQREKAQQEKQAEALITALAELDATSPDYESKVAVLIAKYPKGMTHPAAQKIMELKEGVRVRSPKTSSTPAHVGIKE